MLSAWLAESVPHLIQVATLPFERLSHDRYFASIDWKVSREDWYPETCFEIHFQDVGRRLIAVYEESETGLGIGLYALTGLPAPVDFCIGSKGDFDAAFEATLDIIRPLFRVSPSTGTYECQFDDLTYHYAYWCFPETFLTLVQHFEGDGHCGNDASLDLRIIPRSGSHDLVFPLRTNILF